MKAGRKLGVFFTIVVALGAGGWYVFHATGAGSQTSSASQGEDTIPPSLTKEYRNNTHAFSLKIPADFTVQEMPADENGLQTIVFQNGTGDGVQISISPFDEDLSALTKERIQQDVPDMKITGEQPVEIGSSHQGLAFKSDNAAFGGASREVWFVFRGNLYQISTYERLDPLLKAIFQTWQFF